jgi:hypothetical protein
MRITSTRLQPIVNYGPGYSLLIACGIRAGLDARSSAALVNAASYVVYAVVLCLLLLEVTRHALWPFAFLLGSVLILQPAVLLLVDNIGSDLPAAALWLCAVYLAIRLLRHTEPDRASVTAVAICMSLALWTRWAMLYALVALSSALLISLPGTWRIRDRVRATAVIALLPLCALAPWVLRNYLTTRTVLGYRMIELDDPLRIAAQAMTGLVSGFWAGDPSAAFELARRSVTVVSIALLVFVFATRRGWRYAPVRLLLASAGGYTLLLILSASVNPIDPLSTPRWWLPVWPLLGAAALGSLARAGVRDRMGTATAFFLAAQLLLTGHGFAMYLLHRLPGARSGQFFFRDSLAQSAPIRFAGQKSAADYRLFSNEPSLVLVYGGVDRIYDLPDSADVLRPLVEAGDVRILLFTEPVRPRLDAGLPAHRRAIETLRSEGLLERVDADHAGEVWRSAKAD